MLRSLRDRLLHRRKSFPSETRVKRGRRFVHGDVELLEKLGRNDCARAAPDEDFKAGCMGSGCYDGANRNDYFQGVSIAPAACRPVRRAVTGLGTALHSLAIASRACSTCALFMARSGKPDFVWGEGGVRGLR